LAIINEIEIRSDLYPNLKFMKSYLCILLIINLFISVNCQVFSIAGQIKDKESGDDLPFSNIMLKGYPIGTTSNNQGFFQLDYSDTIMADTVVISYIGYKSLELPIKSINDQPIELAQLSIDIKEVVVKSKTKKLKSVTLNKFNKRDCILRHSISPFDTTGNFHIPYRPKEPTIEALYFPFDSKYSDYRRIKSISFRAKSFTDTSTIRLRIFEPTIDNRPGNDILLKSLIIKVFKNNPDVTIDLSDEKIIMPESGIFIGFELLIVPDNITIMTNDIGNEAIVYSPFVYQIYSKEKSSTWIYSRGEWSNSKYWYFRQGIWIESENSRLADKKTVGPYFFNPAISLILSE
jgi:hypothetical protein